MNKIGYFPRKLILSPGVQVYSEIPGRYRVYYPFGVINIDEEMDGLERRFLDSLIEKGEYCCEDHSYLKNKVVRYMIDLRLVREYLENDREDPFFSYARMKSPGLCSVKKISISLSGDSVVSGVAKDVLSKLGFRVIEKSVHSEAGCFLEVNFSKGLSKSALDSNRAAFNNNNPILFVIDFGDFFKIGPLVVPELKTPCLECLYWRSRSASMNEDVWSRMMKFSETRPRSYISDRTQVDIAALEIIKYASTGLLFSYASKFFDVRPLDWMIEKHFLVKVPGCPCCSLEYTQRSGGS